IEGAGAGRAARGTRIFERQDRPMFRPRFAWLALLAIVACDTRGSAPAGAAATILADGVTPDDLAARVARFAPVRIDFDDTSLDVWERQVLQKLVAASDVMHEIFTVQVSADNPEWAERVATYTGPGAEAARAYFDIMVGPWD